MNPADGRPPWLLAAEHGALGEARAKSLLLERFWVLERSVDVHGADFLIQRRLLGTHILKRDSPRFGVIQVKFVQDGRTPIRVPSDHVRDEGATCYEEERIRNATLTSERHFYQATGSKCTT